MACLAFLLLLTGCGGGGGGSSGAGVDPVEIEISTVLAALADAVAGQNLDGAMSWMDSNLHYFPSPNATPEGYNAFRARLQNFFGQATVISCAFPSPGPGITGDETSARFRGTLTYSWQVGSGPVEQRQEQVEMLFERNVKWGVVSLSGWNLSGLEFPPAP